MLNANRVNYLRDFLAKCMAEGAFPGACFGIVSVDESYSGFMGNAQVEPIKREMRGDSVFDLASLTKVIATTTSIMILIENGEIGLYDRIKSILPGYRYEDTTIFQLLTHTSGLPAEIKFYRMCRNYEEVIDRLYDVELEYKPGEKVLYSDMGFMLLGLVVEKVAEPIYKFANMYVFEPMGMFDTCYNPPEELKKRCVATEYSEDRGMIVGEVHDGNAYIMGGASGHAGLFSTVPDLVRFVEMILNDGYYKGKRILGRAAIDAMGRCYTEGLNERRGLGWELKTPGHSMGDLVSDNVLYHTGFTGTSILIDRQYGLGFVLLTNRVHPTRENQKLIPLRGYINNIAMTTILK
ncbi:MAG: serine hydrolase domain-containing protein [Thermoanaerobacteraceae bacterium]|nr:serine hydrolase domain-containing protein [Thermoanaerobacteraceae bacterium]